ncbi:hypothetical protein HYQ45_005339 [Verticillium longisporum]|uniref:Uncharacterized protein n=1 Tax=Verticillium longisporum TaxID=100787 RepID=A0A8I2ZUN3_VERLO|nr:hypothetical protein HYQ45_005339 [Verticillium longisporum]
MRCQRQFFERTLTTYDWASFDWARFYDNAETIPSEACETLFAAKDRRDVLHYGSFTAATRCSAAFRREKILVKIPTSTVSCFTVKIADFLFSTTQDLPLEATCVLWTR